MAKYDLTGNLEKEFTFNIGSDEYRFRKPTVREMRGLAKSFAGIEKSDDPDEQAELSNQAMMALYEYITPVNPDGRAIAEVLDEQPMETQLRFNEMIQKELGAKQ